MDHHHKNHGMGAVTMHVAEEIPEGHHELQVLHVIEGAGYGGRVVKHQQHPRKGKNHKKIEGDDAGAPMEAHPHAVLTDFGWQNVVKDIVRYRQEPITPIHGVPMSEDRLPDLALLDLKSRLARPAIL